MCLKFRTIKGVQHFRSRGRMDARLLKMQNYHAKSQTLSVDCVLKEKEKKELRGMKVSTVVKLLRITSSAVQVSNCFF